MKPRKKFSRFFAVFLFLSVILVSKTFAQQSAGLQVRPAIIEEKLDPDSKFSFSISVTNLSDEKKELEIVKRRISGMTESGQPIFLPENLPLTELELVSWITSAEKSIIVLPRQTKSVAFTVSAPVNASPGSHFAGIFFSLKTGQAAGTSISIGYQVGTLVNIRVAGEVVEEILIREFRTDKLFYGKPRVRFISRLENTGSVLSRPRGPLEIIDYFGKKTATLTVNNEGAALLPRSVREFETFWEEQGLRFGKYEAVLGLSYGEEEKKTVFATLSFWILPLGLILPILGTLLIIALVIIVGVKIYVRRKLQGLSVLAQRAAVGGRKTPARGLMIILAILALFLIFLMLLFLFFA